MDKIKAIQKDHKLSFSVDSIPYKYISQTIRDYVRHIEQLESIVSKDTEVLKFREIVKLEITSKIKYLQDKLDKVPNLKYLDESDEDFVDNYM